MVLAGWLLATAGLLTAAVFLPGLRVDGILARLASTPEPRGSGRGLDTLARGW